MTTTRREFLGTASCLALAFHVPMTVKAKGPAPAAGGSFEPNAFLNIDAEGHITVWANRSDMGQGVRTSMAMVVAEELEADWTKVAVKQADTSARFGNLGITGGSQSTRTTTQAYRKVGAQARELLLQAAADTWGVPKSECHAEQSVVHHKGSNKSLGYGALVAKASTLTPPADPPLKARKDFKVLGKDARRLDGPDIVTGKAEYGTDIRVPGMLTAAIARCPVFGGKVKAFDATEALKVPGVKQVIETSRGVAVLAIDTYAAFTGREFLKIIWDEGAGASTDSASIRQQYETRLKTPGKVVRDEGKVAGALPKAAKHLTATYDCPFLAHATLEPMVGVASVKADLCEIWAPTQAANMVIPALASIAGVKPEQVLVHIPLLGGGFGRRAMPDFMFEAVECSRKAGVPVKVQWSREDDMQHDGYRPATLHHIEGGIDANGQAMAWRHQFAGPSIMESNHLNFGPPEGAELEGAADLAYAIPNLEVEWAQSDSSVPLWFWRAVAASFNPFVTECFMDELAHTAGKDPLAFRLEHMHAKPTKVNGSDLDPKRLETVLKLAAEKAGWGRKLPKGHGMGIAAHPYLECGTYVAEVAEVEVMSDGQVKVHRVVAAVDCGMVLNPLNAKAQVEGGIVYGLSAALFGEITLEKGRVKQHSFKDYPIVRMVHMPKVEVHFVQSDLPPGGIGEPGLPPLAPAVGNAIFAATGKRMRSLPMLPAKVLQG